MGSPSGDDVAAFAAAQHPRLVRAAWLLTGEHAAAQDLAQETLVRLLAHWGRVRRADDPAAYASRILVNVFLSSRRRRWWGELPTAQLPEHPDREPYGQVDDRDLLRRALQQMPARQRAAVVLRHYEQRSEAQVAELLGCSVGTVKSLTSRGLTTLRALMVPEGEGAR